MGKYDFIFDGMTWSFSRLNYTCLYEFYLNYIECRDKQDNFFAQIGTLMHTIFEKLVKEELAIFEISQYFVNHFDEVVTEQAPYNMYSDLRQSYYNQCLDYLDNFSLDYSKYDILGVEKEVNITIGKIDLVGYIDLLIRDKETGDIIVVDYKSSIIKFKKKDGKPVKKDEPHWLAFQRQEYLYSKAVIEEYGVAPKYLEWIMFRANEIKRIPWIEEDYKTALKWAEETAEYLKSLDEFPSIAGDDYYCINLCSFRNSCEKKQKVYEEKMAQKLLDRAAEDLT